MRTSRWLMVAATVLVARAVPAQEMVAVSGSDVKYPTVVENTLNEKKVKLKLTGAAMRKKTIFNVYTIGSYIQEDSTVKSAEDLASADVIKQFHLVMQRSVAGEDMAEAFLKGLRNNYPQGIFEDELKRLVEIIKANDIEKGDQVWITNYPGYGLHFNLVGKKAEFVKGVKFSKAVWEIYFGPQNISEGVKKSLSSRL